MWRQGWRWLPSRDVGPWGDREERQRVGREEAPGPGHGGKAEIPNSFYSSPWHLPHLRLELPGPWVQILTLPLTSCVTWDGHLT